MFEKAKGIAGRWAAGALTLFVAVSLTACADFLDTTNVNEPTTAGLEAAPGSVPSLVSSSFLTYWGTNQYYWPGNMLSVGADEFSSSWGNFGMKDFSQEPRRAFDNSPSYTYAFATEFPFRECFSAIVAASTGLQALATDKVQAALGDEELVRTEAFAKFIQGLCHGYVGAMFDQAYTVDENNLGTPEAGQLRPFDEVITFGINKLKEARTIANNNTFQLPSGWVPGAQIDDARLARLASSYMARYEMWRARRPTQTNKVDWQFVYDNASAATGAGNGIEQDLMIDAETADGFWSGIKTLGASNWIIWGRVDMRTVGHADTSGNFQDWTATPSADKNALADNQDVFTADERVAPNADFFPSSAAYAPTGDPYQIYWSTIFLRPERGTYHYSAYGDLRYSTYETSCTFCWFGIVPIMTMTEMKLRAAEAAIELGNPGDAVPIVNQTRAMHGLDPVTTTGEPAGIGTPCVPRDAETGDCPTLFQALKHEKRMEVFQMSSGNAYFDDRRWGDLVTGTPIHLPVPGLELDILEKEIYTFGGQEGGCQNCDVVPVISNDVANVLKRVKVGLDNFEKHQRELQGRLDAVSKR